MVRKLLQRPELDKGQVAIAALVAIEFLAVSREVVWDMTDRQRLAEVARIAGEALEKADVRFAAETR